MVEKTRFKHFLSISFLLVTIPIVVIYFVLWCIGALFLIIAFRILYGLRGYKLILVYSDSPVWKSYFEKEIIPKIKEYSVVLNSSERSRWKFPFSLPILIYMFFAGQKEFNPIAMLFMGISKPKIIRFYSAFKTYKNGDEKEVRELSKQLF